MSEQTAFVGPKRAAEKMARDRAVPGVAELSARVRVEMAEADQVDAEKSRDDSRGRAAGDHPRCVVTVNGQAVELDLAALAREGPAPHFSPFPITSRRRLPLVGGRVGRRPSPKGHGVPFRRQGSWHTARVGEGQLPGRDGPSRGWSAPGLQEGQSPPFVTTTSKR
jgi:uncharacterized small protein (DUF1192 family)